MLLVVGGLFVNHLFAKVGLFWLAGYVGKEAPARTGRSVPEVPAAIFVFGILLAAISGLPPFPGFWAKWQLVLSLAAGERYVWIAVVLLGSLLEAAYLFRWFGQVVHSPAEAGNSQPRGWLRLLPVFGMAVLLIVERLLCGASSRASTSLWMFAAACRRARAVAARPAACAVTGRDRTAALCWPAASG